MKIGFTLPHMGSIYPPSPDGSWPEIYQNVIDPVSSLTYVAGLTKKIKLATGSLDMLYHSPLILANRLTALDNLSHGRLMLGVGIGHSKDEFQASGVPFEERGKRADEFLAVLDKIWYNDKVEHDGKYYTIPQSVVGPKPYQEKIPIYLGAFSLKALHRVITSNADGWLSFPQMNIELFKSGQEQLKSEAKKHGRDPQSIEFPVLVAPEVTSKDLGRDRMSMNGSVEQIAEDLKEYEKLGINHVNLVFDFGTHSQDLMKRLDYSKQIRDAMMPALLN